MVMRRSSPMDVMEPKTLNPKPYTLDPRPSAMEYLSLTLSLARSQRLEWQGRELDRKEGLGRAGGQEREREREREVTLTIKK
jgi:hypothetical protein